MTGPAPWSVKGIDPRAREAAREAARRHGLTIGEWLNQAILANEAALADARRDGGGEAGDRPTPKREAGKETRALTEALAQLAQRVEANDRRTALAMSGLDRTLANVAERIEQAEAAAASGGGAVGDLIEELRDAQAALINQMQRIESEDLPQIQADEAHHQARVHGLEAEIRALSERAVQAEAATGEALRTLKSSMAALDEKIGEAGGAEQVRAAFDEKLDSMARDVVAMVADARADMANQIAEALGGLKPEEMNEALADMSRRVAASERRHAQTIEAVSIEIKRLSESMDRRLRVVEQRNDDGAAAAMREEIANVARTLDQRLSEMETREASAFTRVSDEVGRVAESLDARVAASEARSAQAIEQVGEQVALMAERLSERQDRFAAEISQRIQQNEERHGARLSDALAAITARLGAIESGGGSGGDLMGRAASSFAARIQALEERVSGGAPARHEPSHADEPLATTPVEDEFEPGPVAELALPDEPVEAAEIEDEPPVLGDVPAAERDVSIPLMDRETIYVEEIQARFASREEQQNAGFTEFDLPPPPPTLAPRHDPFGEAAAHAPGADPFAEITTDDPFSDGRAPDPFADIEAAPPADDDDLFWSTGKQEEPIERDAAAEAALGLREEDLPAAAPETDDPFGAFNLDDEPPFSEERFDDLSMEEQQALDRDAELEREMFDTGLDLDAPAASKSDYLAAARRAAQAHAQNGAANKAWREKITLRAPPAPKDADGDEPPEARLRGVNRVIFWGAAGAIVAVLAGGAYVYSHSQGGAHDSDEGALPAKSGAGLARGDYNSDLPPGSIAEGAARASAERAAATDAALTPSGEPQAVDLPDEEPVRAGPLESSLIPPAGDGEGLPVRKAAFIVSSAEDAAQRGDPVAQYELALQRLGAGETQNAVSLLKRAAGQGLAMAQYRLAKLYERGEGVAMDLTEARKWTERAAVAGNRKAMHDLGVYYARGEGAPFDEGQAFKWFRQAAEHGVEDSQFNLGVLYAQGRGVAADQGEALYWFSIAAAAGDPDARARAAMLEQQLGEAADAIKTRARAFKPKPGLARANGEFGQRPWAPAATLQAAVDARRAY